MKIAVLSSHTPSLFWFRMDMMLSFKALGHEVVAIGNEPAEKWADVVIDKKGARVNTEKIMREKGYDIESSVKRFVEMIFER